MNDYIKHLKEQRANAWEQAKSLLDTAASENRDLSAEEESTYARINADIDTLGQRAESMLADERRAAETAEALDRIGATSTPAQPDAFRAFLNGESRSFAVKPEARDLTKGSATAGGNTVPTSFSNMLWEHLIETAAIAGVSTVFNTASGENFEVPVTTTHSTGALITEGSTLTESDPAFAKRTLGAYKYAYSFQVSSELLNDAGVDLTGYFARQAGNALGNALGADLATGNGSSKPSGVVQTSTLGVTGGTGVTGKATADNIIDLFYSVISPYRNSDKCVWLFRDSTAAYIRKLQDNSGGSGVGNYLWTPGLGAAPDTILGKPVVIEPNIAANATSAKSIVFGDMSRYFVRIAGGVRFERSDDFAFQNDLVTFRAILRGDGVLGDQTGAVKHFVGGAS